jgi:hypothetical protein
MGKGSYSGKKQGEMCKLAGFEVSSIDGTLTNLRRSRRAIKISGSRLPGPSNRARYRKFLWTLNVIL